MLDRFIGEARITFRDNKKEMRRVVILSPYIQSSNSLRDIDYDNSLVVDLQTMEFDFKVQLEDMLQNQELHQFHTFIEYAHKTVFRNGENVLQWLHRSNQISKIPAHDVFMVFGQGGKVQKMSVVDLNAEIRAANEKKIAEEEGYTSSYTDPSLNPENTQAATIEKSGNVYKAPEVQNDNNTLNESVVSEYAHESSPMSQHEVTNIDLSQVPGVKILEGDPSLDMDDTVTTPTDPRPYVTESTYDEPVVSQTEFNKLQENLKNLDTLVRKRTKDTFVTRLMDKYDLSESEVTKAIETAGKRKEKKVEKDKQKQSD